MNTKKYFEGFVFLIAPNALSCGSIKITVMSLETPQSIETSSKSKRSVSYPSDTVNKSYDFACKINDHFSSVNEVTREEIGTALGVSANGISRDIAACVHYGFLQKKQGVGSIEGKYKITELFMDIFRPESERDKKIKFITAFGNPKLYQELITKFDGQVIPQELANTLIKHHGITEAAAASAADTFIKSGIFVGVIADNRLLKYKVSLSTISKSTQFAEITDEHEVGGSSNGEEVKPPLPAVRFERVDSPTDLKIPIHLTGEKIAYLMYPADISIDDIEIIDYQLKGISLRIKLEAKNKGTIVPSP